MVTTATKITTSTLDMRHMVRRQYTSPFISPSLQPSPASFDHGPEQREELRRASEWRQLEVDGKQPRPHALTFCRARPVLQKYHKSVTCPS
jgi:hypothetical protein